MEIKKGIGVSPGVAISTAIVLNADNLVTPRRQISPEAIEAELKRFESALGGAITDLTTQRDDLLTNQRKDIAGILEFHIGVLKDKSLIDQITTQIRSHHSTAEYAVGSVMT